MKYHITDTQGNLVRGNFASYQAAFTFLISRGRYDWKITTLTTKAINNYYEKKRCIHFHRS